MHVLEASERFEVAWPDPAMAQAPWVGDRMHFPSPTIPLAQRIVAEFQEKVLGAPTLFVNGYQFSLPPTMPPPPAEVVERGLAVWHEDYSPRIRAYCQRIRGIDFEPMSLAETAREFERIVAEGTEMLRLTMVVVGTFTQPSYQMLEFLETELGEDGPILSGTLLQGFKNESAASGSGLSELVAMASQSPQLAEAARAGDLAAAASAPGGPEFISRLNEFLDDYGWRAETWGAMHLPTWGEHP